MLLLSGSHSCSSLIQFKNSFSIAKDASWYCNDFAGLKSYPKTNSWKEGTDCCSWDGVTCDHLNAHVIALDLSCSWLYGNFPSNTTLFLLPHLQKLNLAYNDFNLSKIPSEFDRSLSLAGCGLQGKFPKNIFDLPNLNLLNLGGNQNLNLNPLKGANFFGGLPDSMGNLVSLKFLNLHYSNLSGPVPRSFGNLLQLTHLYLLWNQLSGQIPRSLGNLLRLTHLDLWKNQLSRRIPRSLGNLLQLTYLSLHENQLMLDNNKLQGPLPSSIFQLLNLTWLSLSSNNLCGVIEFSMFSKLPNLKFLDLSYNSLSLTSNSTSSVNHILPNLTVLYFSSCDLSEFPQILKGLKSLESLDLSCNRIEGKIPQRMKEVGNDSLTNYLNVSHNSLTEVEHFPWKNIISLDLSSNLIRGNLPIPASNISVFFISNNSFNGEVSSLICNATSLQILDLSHNNLSGTIPQ
ncbi:hypothetical protein V6Z11_A04G008200, partial [Gossypium hirsutum]